MALTVISNFAANVAHRNLTATDSRLTGQGNRFKFELDTELSSLRHKHSFCALCTYFEVSAKMGVNPNGTNIREGYKESRESSLAPPYPRQYFIPANSIFVWENFFNHSTNHFITHRMRF